MKAIRWPGLITFTTLLIIMIAGAWLFADSITKSLIESTITDLNGAKADIDSVDISYTPLGIKINDLQITDPERPMLNMVQISEVRFAISFGDLLLKKLVVNDMALHGIQIDTARKKSGAIKKQSISEPVKKNTEDSMFDFAMPDMQLPDVDELIAKEQLNSEILITTLDNDLDATQQKWKLIQDDIQDKKRWDSYQQRYNKIKSDLNGNTVEKISALKDIKALRNDLKIEAEKIQQARKQFSEDNARLSDEFKAAKNGPRDDIRRIKEKYKLNDLSTQNITQLLFGAQTAEYLALAEKWYARIKPYLEDDEEEIAAQQAKQRKHGQDIKFKELNPTPDFYVHKASIDARIPRGEFTGLVTDISSDQSVNKKPMIMKLSGKNLSHRDSETFRAEFNYVNKDSGYSQFDYAINAYQLENFDISKSNKLSLAIQHGLMSLNLSSKLANKRLRGHSNINFENVKFETNKSTESQSFSSMMASSFININKFKLNAKFSGSLHDLDIDLKSDLDNQLGAQLKSQLKKRGEQFEEKLKSRIDDRIKQPLAKLEAKRQKIEQIKVDIDNREDELKQKLADIESKIHSARKSTTDKKKDELLNKLKSKFKL